MFRGLLCLSLAMALCSTVLAAPPKTINGFVVTAGNGKLVMTEPDKTELTFEVDARTVILLNNAPARLEALKPGMSIRLMVDDRLLVKVEVIGRQ